MDVYHMLVRSGRAWFPRTQDRNPGDITHVFRLAEDAVRRPVYHLLGTLAAGDLCRPASGTI